MRIAIGVTVVIIGTLGLINRKRFASNTRKIHNRMYNTDKDEIHFEPFQIIIPSVAAIACGSVFIAMGIFDR